jgi:hypothetical protein
VQEARLLEIRSLESKFLERLDQEISARKDSERRLAALIDSKVS